MMNYYRTQASLESWKGHFKSAITAIHGLINEAKMTKDSDKISASYRTLAAAFYNIGQKDSALAYANLSFSLKPQVFAASSYPLTVIAYDHNEGMKLKGVFDSLMNVFQSQVPKGMWSLVEALRTIYGGAYDLDTAAIITGLKTICDNPTFVSGGNLRQLAETQMYFGQFNEALATIELATSDKFASSNGYSVLNLLYVEGRAHEGLGHNNEAVAAYQEMLKYWGDPDIEIKIIADAKERLARLTS